LKIKPKAGQRYEYVKQLLGTNSLHTVCQEAGCPNIFKCFESGTATLLILGDTCTRKCRFCLVNKGLPKEVDLDEPVRVARAVKELGLGFAVVTSVTRDDLPDGGASVFSKVVREIRRFSPGCEIELLIPDFAGSRESLTAVIGAGPDILNHNVETVPRLYPLVRPLADYQRSLTLMANAKEISPTLTTKSGLMIGLGEELNEVIEVLLDLRRAECDIITIGQYLSPTPDHLPVARYYNPHEFEEFKDIAQRLGFAHVESAPLVRSSYRSAKQL